MNKNNLSTILITAVTTAVVFFLIELVILPSLGLKKTEQSDIAPIAKTGEAKTSEAVIQPKTAAQIQMEATNAQTESIIKKVFSHVFLPAGDIKVESILKPDDLRKINPIFYQYAKVGDIVLIYPDRAVLYDPIADKVLDILHIEK